MHRCRGGRCAGNTAHVGEVVCRRAKFAAKTEILHSIGDMPFQWVVGVFVKRSDSRSVKPGPVDLEMRA